MPPDNRIVRLATRVLAGPPCRVGRLLRDGDEVAGFRVVHAPGHTAGHVVFFREWDRVAIAGDLLANFRRPFGQPRLREPPTRYSVDPDQNRRSVKALAALGPRIACFGHGPPVVGDEALAKFLSSQVW
jgi:glyoxylase-like metal-dependent hydrolase (beta-lactamase superfamily II)